MRSDDLKIQIEIEFRMMEKVINEVMNLKTDALNQSPTIREIAAASSFLAQFYNGIDNILKRIARFNNIPLPKGESWHIELFNRFCDPPSFSLPLLFDNKFKPEIASFRKFRHIVFHGYSF
jgi:hypothetical protein